MNIWSLHRQAILFLILWVCGITSSKAYSVLAHEALIDASWGKELKPLLKERFKSATDSQLNEAHAYAYGGAIIQDMGYYPLGSAFLQTCFIMYAREIL